MKKFFCVVTVVLCMVFCVKEAGAKSAEKDMTTEQPETKVDIFHVVFSSGKQVFEQSDEKGYQTIWSDCPMAEVRNYIKAVQDAGYVNEAVSVNTAGGTLSYSAIDKLGRKAAISMSGDGLLGTVDIQIDK